jgi:gliding motility-associated-like protein
MAGLYVLTVEDPRGCVGVDSLVLVDPLPLVPIDTSFSLPTCPGDNNGNITLFMEGGTAPYNYTWSTGVSTSNPLLPGLRAGNYSVTVTDANLCFMEEFDLNLADPPHIEGLFSDITLTSCPVGGDCDGAVSIAVSGGTEVTTQYNFFWSSGETVGSGSNTSRAIALCPGEQFVVVANTTCADSFFIDIPSPDSIDLDLASSQLKDANCFAINDASAIITATGGTPGYTYEWNTGATGPDLMDVFAGDYVVSITDMNGCEHQETITLNQPEAISAWIDTLLTQDVTCTGSTDGSIFVNYSGGNPGPVSYTWSDNISDSSFALNVAPGFYLIEVFDTNNCTAQTFWTVNEPQEVIANISGDETLMCFGETNTVLIDSATGGNGPGYSWSVNDGPRLPIAIGLDLGAGDYELEIIDRLGCVYDTLISIIQPPEIVVNAGPDLEIKLGNSTNINLLYNSFHGVSQITWDPPNEVFCEDPTCDFVTITPSVSETYTVTLVDSIGCAVSDEIFIDVNASRDVFIPNTFSPNKDGYNDKFLIYTGPGIRNINSMQIFDRWGEIVFEKLNVSPSSAGSEGWNGEYQGNLLNPAVFIYVVEIEFIDDTVLLYRGDVTLVR